MPFMCLSKPQVPTTINKDEPLFPPPSSTDSKTMSHCKSVRRYAEFTAFNVPLRSSLTSLCVLSSSQLEGFTTGLAKVSNAQRMQTKEAKSNK